MAAPGSHERWSVNVDVVGALYSGSPYHVTPQLPSVSFPVKQQTLLKATAPSGVVALTRTNCLYLKSSVAFMNVIVQEALVDGIENVDPDSPPAHDPDAAPPLGFMSIQVPDIVLPDDTFTCHTTVAVLPK